MKVMKYKGDQYVHSHMHALTAAHDLFQLSHWAQSRAAVC